MGEKLFDDLARVPAEPMPGSRALRLLGHDATSSPITCKGGQICDRGVCAYV